VIALKFATYGVLGLTYLGLALGYIPGRMNRATIALVGSAFLIGLGYPIPVGYQKSLKKFIFAPFCGYFEPKYLLTKEP
jgi:hypothetical protein